MYALYSVNLILVCFILYSCLKSCDFLCYLQVYATGFIPYIGKVLNFLLLSWMYAYYCFEYVVQIHLCLISSFTNWIQVLKYTFWLGINGISTKWLLTEGWTTLNLTGHFLLVLVKILAFFFKITIFLSNFLKNAGLFH